MSARRAGKESTRRSPESCRCGTARPYGGRAAHSGSAAALRVPPRVRRLARAPGRRTHPRPVWSPARRRSQQREFARAPPGTHSTAVEEAEELEGAERLHEGTEPRRTNGDLTRRPTPAKSPPRTIRRGRRRRPATEGQPRIKPRHFADEALMRG